tara:strand:- start:45808 stop:46239 length:432 start_codon:yes stop_codon:yes gene_type:complete
MANDETTSSKGSLADCYQCADHEPEPVVAPESKPSDDFIDFVFDGPPGPECGRFVESEDPSGASISAGEWIDRKDGYWALRVKRPATAPGDFVARAKGIVAVLDTRPNQATNHKAIQACEDLTRDLAKAVRELIRIARAGGAS